MTTAPAKFSKEFQPEHRQKYETLKKKEIVPNYMLHRESIQLLGVAKRVQKYFDNVRWGVWLRWSSNVYE